MLLTEWDEPFLLIPTFNILGDSFSGPQTKVSRFGCRGYIRCRPRSFYQVSQSRLCDWHLHSRLCAFLYKALTFISSFRHAEVIVASLEQRLTDTREAYGATATYFRVSTDKEALAEAEAYKSAAAVLSKKGNMQPPLTSTRQYNEAQKNGDDASSFEAAGPSEFFGFIGSFLRSFEDAKNTNEKRDKSAATAAARAENLREGKRRRAARKEANALRDIIEEVAKKSTASKATTMKSSNREILLRDAPVVTEEDSGRIGVSEMETMVAARRRRAIAAGPEVASPRTKALETMQDLQQTHDDNEKQLVCEVPAASSYCASETALVGLFSPLSGFMSTNPGRGGVLSAKKVSKSKGPPSKDWRSQPSGFSITGGNSRGSIAESRGRSGGVVSGKAKKWARVKCWGQKQSEFLQRRDMSPTSTAVAGTSMKNQAVEEFYNVGGVLIPSSSVALWAQLGSRGADGWLLFSVTARELDGRAKARESVVSLVGSGSGGGISSLRRAMIMGSDLTGLGGFAVTAGDASGSKRIKRSVYSVLNSAAHIYTILRLYPPGFSSCTRTLRLQPGNALQRRRSKELFLDSCQHTLCLK